MWLQGKEERKRKRLEGESPSSGSRASASGKDPGRVAGKGKGKGKGKSVTGGSYSVIGITDRAEGAGVTGGSNSVIGISDRAEGAGHKDVAGRPPGRAEGAGQGKSLVVRRRGRVVDVNQGVVTGSPSGQVQCRLSSVTGGSGSARISDRAEGAGVAGGPGSARITDRAEGASVAGGPGSDPRTSDRAEGAGRKAVAGRPEGRAQGTGREDLAVLPGSQTTAQARGSVYPESQGPAQQPDSDQSLDEPEEGTWLVDSEAEEGWLDPEEGNEALPRLDRDIFGSSSHSAPPRDFDGFERSQGEERLGSRSKRKKDGKHRSRRKRKRRRHSDSESESSDAPKAASPVAVGQRPVQAEQLFSQLQALFSQLPAQASTPPVLAQPPEPVTPQPGPPAPGAQRPLELATQVAGHHRAASMGGSEDEDDGEPLLGTDIPQEAFDRAVEVIRRILGFETPEVPETPNPRQSRLSLNAAAAKPTVAVPLDAECFDRYEAIANARRWRSFASKPLQTVQVSKQDWTDLLCVPVVPEQAQERLTAEGVLNKKGVYVNQTRQKEDTLLRDVDSASRVGLRYASTLLLVADIITRSFQEVESGGVSREDTGRVVALLGPLSRLIFDQFSRTSVRSVKARRGIVLDAVKWPATAMRTTLEKLPLIGGDLFGGQFDEALQSQATKLKSLKEAGLQLPTPAPAKQKNWQGRPSFPTGRSYRKDRQRGRGRGFQNRSRQQSYDKPRGGSKRGRGWSRGGFKPYP